MASSSPPLTLSIIFDHALSEGPHPDENGILMTDWRPDGADARPVRVGEGDWSAVLEGHGMAPLNLGCSLIAQDGLESANSRLGVQKRSGPFF